MESSPKPNGSMRQRGAAENVRVIVLRSVMLLFLSYWRVAAVVLCDLASA